MHPHPSSPPRRLVLPTSVSDRLPQSSLRIFLIGIAALFFSALPQLARASLFSDIFGVVRSARHSVPPGGPRQLQRGPRRLDYGVFDVNPKSGFERSLEGELIATASSALQTEEQLSFGDHTRRAAYYVSLNGNRSDYGLSPPVEQAFHDAEDGYSGFGSFTFNRDAKSRFRLLTQLRADFFQIPHDLDPNDYEYQLYDSSGLRDAQHKTDGVVALTWSQSLYKRL